MGNLAEIWYLANGNDDLGYLAKLRDGVLIEAIEDLTCKMIVALVAGCPVRKREDSQCIRARLDIVSREEVFGDERSNSSFAL